MTGHKFRPWQEEALRRIRGQSRVALFMEMRLGKTPVIIRWAKEQTADHVYPWILIVAPMATLDDWEEELTREGCAPVHRLDRERTAHRVETVEGNWGWFLIHPEGLRIAEDLADVEWDVAIVDESTMIRNPKAKITKMLVHQFQHVPNRAIMTGDPRPESELDYFCQMQFLHGSFMGFGGTGGYWTFRNVKYEQHPKFKWDWSPKPGLRDEIKQYVHDRAVVMTAKQVGMGNETIMKTRVVEMNPAQARAIKEITKEFQFEYIETNFATVRDVWLARVAGGFSPDRENPELLSPNKADGIVELMTGEMRREPSVIWFRFNEELEYVVRRLNKAKVRTIGVSGLTPKEDRKHIRARFMDGSYQVICVQVRLGRMGWNLSRASVAQYYSNALDFESRAQSMKRIEHMTKRSPLLYIDWVTRGSIDQEVVQLLKEKRMTSRAFMRRLNSNVLDQLRSLYGLKGKGKEKEISPQTKIRRIFPGTLDSER